MRKETEMKKRMNLNLFGLPEDETTESLLDMLGDHGDITANMSDEAVAMLVVASRIENMSRILEDINSVLIGMGGDIEALGNCVGYAPSRYKKGEGTNFLRIGGSVDTGN